jgi:serine/threonine protein kinase
MVQKGILHRDISVNNILLGVNGSDSEEGWRGVLIDFDMAIFISRLEFLSKEVRTVSASAFFIILATWLTFPKGTRMFQSLNVLDGWRTHDFLDDLESFLYVLTFLVFAFPEPGQDERELPEQLQEWNRDELDKAFSSKSTFINYGLRKLAVPPKWGPHIETLIDDLCGYFQPIHKASCRMANPKLSEAKYDKMSQSFKKRYLENRDEQYDEVVGYFEDAISAILADQTCPEATGSIRTSPVARKGHNKRESQEACPDDAEEPSPKRSRC